MNDETKNEEVKEIEMITLPESSEGENKDDEELITEETLKDDKEDSSVQEPEVKQTEEVVLEKEAPKPVENETPREHALRLEVERLKGLRREERKADLVSTEKKVETIEKKDVLSKYDQQELANLKEVLGVFADEFGFVRKDQLQTSNYQGTADTILDDFLQSHSEYAKENDKDDVLWGRFKEEFALYKQPENPRDVKKILERVHQSISGTGRTLNQNALNAQQQKVKQAAHGGTTVAKAPSSKTVLDSKMRAGLKGFDDKEIDELFT